MSIKQRYLFLGGPWHGRTEIANGSPYVQVPETLKAAWLPNSTTPDFSYAPTFTTYTYQLCQYSFGENKIVSAYILGDMNDVPRLFSNFMMDLFNMYVEA